MQQIRGMGLSLETLVDVSEYDSVSARPITCNFTYVSDAASKHDACKV